MDIADITAENVAKAVGGTVERDGSILCRCPVHEASGTHNPSLLLSITKERRILFHCRSQNCDAKHYRAIRDHLVEKCGLPRSHVGGSSHTPKEIHYDYQNPDWSYAWTKVRCFTKSGKKRMLRRLRNPLMRASSSWHAFMWRWPMTVVPGWRK